MTTLLGYARAHAAIHHVCEAFNVTIDELLSRDRHERVSWPRQVAMALACETSDMTQSEVAKMFKRSHADVYWAVRKVNGRCECHPWPDGAKVEEIRNKVSNEKFG